MNLLKIFQSNRTNKSFQGKTGKRNWAALQALKKIGYPLPKVRKALIELNGLTLAEISAGEVSIPTVANTLKGIRNNAIAKSLIAQKLSLSTNELFPE